MFTFVFHPLDWDLNIPSMHGVSSMTMNSEIEVPRVYNDRQRTVPMVSEIMQDRCLSSGEHEQLDDDTWSLRDCAPITAAPCAIADSFNMSENDSEFQNGLFLKD